MSLNFASQKGVLTCNGERFRLKGVNYFGFESSIYVVQGLWCRKLADVLDWFVSEKFNAVRLPFPCDLALNLDGITPSGIDFSMNPELEGLSSGKVLDFFVSQCAQRGLLVMLDMHVLYGGSSIPGLWYDSKTTESMVLQGWKNMLLRYNSWNVFAVDVKNEPHLPATWGDGNAATDFQAYANRAGNFIQSVNSNVLVFVEGVDNYGGIPSIWGGTLAGVATHPVSLSNETKLVYSPHSYGPNVSGNSNCATSNEWQSNFGVIKDMNRNAVVVGEWGGDVGDYGWQSNFANWLVEKDMGDNFYWCFDCTSSDTKGLVEDDWVTPIPEKLGFCSTAQPNPSVITMSNGAPSFGVSSSNVVSSNIVSPTTSNVSSNIVLSNIISSSVVLSNNNPPTSNISSNIVLSNIISSSVVLSNNNPPTSNVSSNIALSNIMSSNILTPTSNVTSNIVASTQSNNIYVQQKLLSQWVANGTSNYQYQVNVINSNATPQNIKLHAPTDVIQLWDMVVSSNVLTLPSYMSGVPSNASYEFGGTFGQLQTFSFS